MSKKMTSTVAVADPQAEASDKPRPDFFVYTGALKGVHDDDGERPAVLATASSNAVDLESDRFTAKALKQMKEGFVGKLIFLNHSYEVPMDVFGLVMKAELVKREGRLDLDMVIGVEMNNPMAVQTYQYIINGTRLGISVGVIVTDAEKSDDEDDNGRNIFDINGVIPLEASVVGIPANQTAWTRQAMKSLYQRGAIDLSNKDIEARPWLQTAIQATEGRKDGNTLMKLDKDTRLWVTTDDGEVVVEITDEDTKEAIMAETNKSDESKDKDADDKDADDKDADDKDADDKDADDKDADDKDADEKCSTCELPMEPGDDAPEPLVCQNCLDDADEKKDDPDESKDKDGDTSEEKDAEGDGSEEKDKDADGSGEKKDFDDDVAADEAADMLISKMFTGLYVALDNLIPILMDTDLSAGERAKQGTVVIDDWTKFVTETWTDITDHLNGEKGEEPDKEFDLAASMHAFVAKQDDTSCDQRGIESVTAKVKDIGDTAEVTADANTQLEETVARQKEALKLMEGVIETMMQLPLQPVTTAKGNGGVAQRLAEVAPTLDTRVVERMAHFDPSNRQEKE